MSAQQTLLISDSKYAQFLQDSLTKLNLLADLEDSRDKDVLSQVFACPLLQRRGVWCEFGVAIGKSLRRLASERGEASLWGFDVFTGLPEDWLPGFPRGSFKQDSIPLVDGAHIVSGLFRETLPSWLPRRPITLAHIDCDLYEGASQALDKVFTHIEPGSILVFDEVWNVADFEKNEMLALYQALTQHAKTFLTPIDWEWLFASRAGQSAAILIK